MYSRRIILPLVSLALALVFAASAQAGNASEPTGPIWNWQGFYAGFNAGWGRNHGDLSLGCIDPAGVLNGPICQNVPNSNTDASGLIGGGQVGYNRQFDRHIVGIEVDFQGAGISGSRTINGPFQFFGGGTALPAAQYTAEERLEWFGTARLRFGHAITDRTIIYGTGGLAVGRYELETNFVSGFSFSFPVDKSVTKVGWTIGGGIERAFSPNSTLRLEALYYDLGDEKLSAPCGPGCGAGALGFIRESKFNLRGVIIRVGINWAFGR